MLNVKSSAELQTAVADWAKHKGFNAPYGVLTSEHQNPKGKGKYLSVTFGRPRTLDVEVKIYNRNFIIIRSSRHRWQAFTDIPSMKAFLEAL